MSQSISKEKIMTFQEENNNLLKFILNSTFLKPWKDKDFFDSLQKNTRTNTLELYVTTDCNQNCEYCYLQKFSDKLYPKTFRNSKLILENLEILLDHVANKLPYLTDIDIFSGEIVGEPLFFEILDRLALYKDRGANYNRIMVPSNFSFILSDEKTKKVKEYIEFLKGKGIDLLFSASVDGYVLEDDTRPLRNGKKRDEDFYNKVFQFCKKYNFCFHPMISAYGIEKWIENYKWWIEKSKEYDFEVLERVMTLEVRNDEWTEEKIKSYQDFLKFYFYHHFEHYFSNDPRKLALQFLGKNNNPLGYYNLLLVEQIQIPSCSISYHFTVRLGDLAIVPCHRLSYDEFAYGKFIVEDGKIVDVEAANPLIATKILLGNQRKNHHGCDTCWNKNTCIKGCFGAQYEGGQEVFMPLESVCNLLKTKTKTLIELYEENGIIEAIKELKTNPTVEDSLVEEMLKIIEDIKLGIEEDSYFNC